MSGMSWRQLAADGRAMRKEQGRSLAQMTLAANTPMMLKAGLVEGDTSAGVLASGQVVGVIDDLPTCEELLDRVVTEAAECLRRTSGLLALRPGKPRRVGQQLQLDLEELVDSGERVGAVLPEHLEADAPEQRRPAQHPAQSSGRPGLSRRTRPGSGPRRRSAPWRPSAPGAAARWHRPGGRPPRAGRARRSRASPGRWCAPRAPGSRAPGCRRGGRTSPARQRPRPHRVPDGEEPPAEVLRRDRLHSRVDRVAELVVPVHDQQRQQVVAAADVAVDRRGHDPEIACDGSHRQRGRSVGGEVAAPDPGDVRRGSGRGLADEVWSVAMGSSCHKVRALDTNVSSALDIASRRAHMLKPRALLSHHRPSRGTP